MSKLRETVSQFWITIQGSLFPWLSEELSEVTKKHQELVTALELLRIERFTYSNRGYPGCPLKSRSAIARSFIAKMGYNMPTTRMLLDRLASDMTLRRICGWERVNDIPHESTFSRAFDEFSRTQLPQLVHETFIKTHYADEIICHNSIDSTAIEAREKPVKKVSVVKQPGKPGRPKKLEIRTQPLTRIERQANGMSIDAMLNELPQACDVGTKRNSKGYQTSWTGYKLHIDTADGGIPISCVLTSVSVHDSQVAIPLAKISHARVTHLYDLMDSAYDVPQIHEISRQLGHIPLIDIHPRRDKTLKEELGAEEKRCQRVGHKTAEAIRYNERGTVERVNARLKDEFGGRFIRVRGHPKVMCHLMFGILALTANQMISLVT